MAEAQGPIANLKKPSQVELFRFASMVKLYVPGVVGNPLEPAHQRGQILFGRIKGAFSPPLVFYFGSGLAHRLGAEHLCLLVVLASGGDGLAERQ
jgi:hypothetical protein